MRRDQKGYTIAELLIAVTILSIVVASVCGFIIVGSRSYATGNSDINIQQESQLALNQMSDVLIDTTRSVVYTAYNTAGSPEKALKDAEFSFTPEDKSLIMFNGVVVKDPSSGADTIEAGNGNKHYHFYWKKASETLFYAELPVNSGDVDTDVIAGNFPDPALADPDADPESTHWYVLAQHVKDFSADLSQVEEKRVVQLALTFEDGKKEYVTSNNVTIRNKVGVNDAELAPLNRKVEVDIALKPSVVLEPSETFVLPAPTVTGKNVTDKSVTWSFVDPGPADDGDGAKNDDGTWKYKTTLTADGILQLADRAKGSFKVRATSNADSNMYADMTVNVKRVTGITLWKSYDSDPGNGPLEISPGCTFTVSGTVNGDFLGQTCDCCGDDTSIDRHILSTKSSILGTDEHVWRIWDPHLHGTKEDKERLPDWHPSQHVIEQHQDEYSATFRVTSDTSDAGDHGYVLQVMSLLSYYRPYGAPTYKGRSYPWVWPSISFTVKSSKNNINVDPGFRWGAVSNIEIGPGYPPGFNKDGQGYYLVCARIKEAGTAKERIMIYGTIGNNPLVTPDLFGLEDIRKSWEVSLQVIDPGAFDKEKGIKPGPGVKLPSNPDDISDSTVRDAVKDYLANCDASGTYTGSLPHTGKFVGTLKPPVIYYEYDGRKNITGELNLNKVYTLVGPVETRFSVQKVENTRGDRDGVSAFTNNNMKFSMYKEKDGGTEDIYWYDTGSKSYKGNDNIVYDGNNYNLPYDGLLQLGNFSNSSDARLIKLELNKTNYYAQAAGRYQIVPSITYTQMADADTSYAVYYADYQPFYGVEQCYKMSDNTVYYELINGGNVDAFWSYGNNEFTKGEIYFPTPSESAFTEYFDREDKDWQNAKKDGYFKKTIINDGRSGTTEYKPIASSMKCRYVADSKIYELKLYYSYKDNSWNREVEVFAGEFQCAAGGDRWVRKTAGTYDGELDRGNRNFRVDCSTANVNFTMKGNSYIGRVYIPLPSEEAFVNTLGYERKVTSWKEKDNFSVKYQPEDPKQGLQDMQIDRMVCAYDKDKDGYTIILFERIKQNPEEWKNIATYFCKSDGTRWERQ